MKALTCFAVGSLLIVSTSAFGFGAVPCSQQVDDLLQSEGVHSGGTESPDSQGEGKYKFSHEGALKGQERDQYRKSLKLATSKEGVNLQAPPNLISMKPSFTDGEKVERFAELVTGKGQSTLTISSYRKKELPRRLPNTATWYVQLVPRNDLRITLVPSGKSCAISSFTVLPSTQVSADACRAIDAEDKRKDSSEGSVTKVAKDRISGKQSDDDLTTAINYCRKSSKVLKMLALAGQGGHGGHGHETETTIRKANP